MQTIDSLFEEHRGDLERLAYRMLGSRADAEDVLQEAYLRWSNTDQESVENSRAFLSTVVTRLSIDRRRMIEARKETYVGPWLPEPLVEQAIPHSPAERLENAESVSLALLVVLESLSPLERAAYLLRRAFDYDYAEIGKVLDQSEANCRQLVSRAQKRIAERRPRFETSQQEAEKITETFLQSCLTGDLDSLTRLLADDAVSYSDGGGKVLAALAPILGADRIARFCIGITKKMPEGTEYRRVRVNGMPGLAIIMSGEVVNVITLDIVEGKVASCYMMRNPDKLPRMEDL